MVEVVNQEVKHEPQDLPKPCNNRKCCGRYMFYAEIDSERVILPLTKVDVKTELRGA